MKKMTVSEKKAWLKTATNEELLKQYTTSTRWAEDPFKYSEMFDLSMEEIFEELNMVEAEILKRMA